MTLKRTEFKRRDPDPAKPKPPKGPRPKTCKTCRQKFTPRTPLAVACSVPCAIEHGKKVTTQQKAKQQRQERAETKQKLYAMHPRKWHIKTLKTAMHEYIRARDEGQPCISCDTILRKLGRPGGDYDAGHFRSVGSAKHLEFEENNIFGQCKYCNDHLKGNQLEYERRLRLRKGDAFVDALKADQAPRKLTISVLEAMTAHYRAKVRELKKETA